MTAALLALLVALGLLLGPAPGADAAPSDTIECSDSQYPLGWLGDLFASAVPFLSPDSETVEVDGREDWSWWRAEIIQESEDGKSGCTLADQPPQLTCAEWETTPDGYKTWGLVPDQCWGSYPTVLYEMNWDDGNWYDVGQYAERISGWIAGFFFLVGRMALQVALWLLDWAYRFDIRQYAGLAQTLSQRYDHEIVGPWGLTDVAWLLLMVFVGFLALRRRVGAAGGELLLTVVLLGLATVLVASPGVYLDSVAETMDLASNDLLATARPPETAEAVADDDGDLLVRACARWSDSPGLEAMLCQLHVEFVERPYLYLNAGSEHLPRECFDAVQNILSTGVDQDGWPARYMARANCPDRVVAWNSEVSGTRMMSALLLVVVAVIVATFLSLLAFTVLIAKFLIVLLFALLPFVVVGAVLPGAGRRIAWSWVATLVQCIVTALAMSALLSLLMLALTELIRRTDEELTILERWGLILLAVCVIALTRKRVLGGAQNIANRLADSLTRTAPSMANWSSGGNVGFDFDRADRVAGRAAVGATYGAAAGTALFFTGLHRRQVERRVAFRGYRNMERLERSRESGFDEWRADAYRYGNRSAAAGGAKGSGGGGPVDGEWRQRNQVLYRTRRKSGGSLLGAVRHPIHSAGALRHRRKVHKGARRAHKKFMKRQRSPVRTDVFRYYKSRGFP